MAIQSNVYANVTKVTMANLALTDTLFHIPAARRRDFSLEENVSFSYWLRRGSLSSESDIIAMCKITMQDCWMATSMSLQNLLGRAFQSGTCTRTSEIWGTGEVALAAC